MSERKETRDARVQVRIGKEAKRMLQRAAALANTSVSAFVVTSALDSASRLIEERERLVLSERDWDVFLDALINPPEPNKALRKAFATHERLIAKAAGE
jgi:uncharacterized protein (DUF1778 family)